MTIAISRCCPPTDMEACVGQEGLQDSKEAESKQVGGG